MNTKFLKLKLKQISQVKLSKTFYSINPYQRNVSLKNTSLKNPTCWLAKSIWNNNSRNKIFPINAVFPGS